MNVISLCTSLEGSARNLGMKTSTMLLAALFLVGPSSAQDKPDKKEEAPNKVEVSVFADKNFEKAVRKQVFAKRDSDAPLTAEDVRNVSVIHGNKMGIKSLEGLEHCVSVAEIRLAENEIEDLGPVKGLKRLQSLSLEKNQIRDITPVGTLAALQYLNLEHNQVRDLSPLKGLEKMNSLYLTDNRIKDISSLAGLKKVWSLYVGDNVIEDISVVGQLPWLQSLEIRDNGLKSLAGLESIRDVRFLDMRNNKVSDLGPLVAACERDAKGDSRFAPFLRLYLEGNEGIKKDQLEALKKIGVRLKG